MKAVIVDIDGKFAVAMDRQGCFFKIKNTGNFTIGYEVDIPSSSQSRFKHHAFMKIASIAAAVLIVIGVGAGSYAYLSPYSYINVDINPSIEITVNRFERIIDIKGLNKDGEKIISLKKLRNKEICEGVSSLFNSALQEGFIKAGSENTVVFTVAGKNKDEVDQLEKEIKDSIDMEVKSAKVNSEVVVQETTLERRQEAAKLGISPGKMLLIEKLREKSPDLKVEDLKDKPVKEIMKSMKEVSRNHGKGGDIDSKPKEEKGNEKDKNVNKNEDLKERNNQGQKGNKSDRDKNNGQKRQSDIIPTSSPKNDNDNKQDKRDNETQKENKKSKSNSKDKPKGYPIKYDIDIGSENGKEKDEGEAGDPKKEGTIDNKGKKQDENEKNNIKKDRNNKLEELNNHMLPLEDKEKEKGHEKYQVKVDDKAVQPEKNDLIVEKVEEDISKENNSEEKKKDNDKLSNDRQKKDKR
ncbi:MAG: hypothetical protein N2645_16270 [Clostridia bacterium]|nr:hypothetical protein [Clostridia bacterium]